MLPGTLIRVVSVLNRMLFICSRIMRSLYRKVISGKFIRFVIVGGISALIEYSLYFIFKNWMDYLVANFLAFGFTNILTFILSRKYVFTSNGARKTEEAALYVVFLTGAYAVNHVVLWGLVEFGTVDDRIAKAVAMAVAVIWNFFTRKHIVFRHRGEPEPEMVRDQAPVKDYPKGNL